MNTAKKHPCLKLDFHNITRAEEEIILYNNNNAR